MSIAEHILKAARLDAFEKVTGRAQYTADMFPPGVLYAKPVCATAAYAKIKSLDTSQALALPGVKAVITGGDYPFLTGPVISDRPALAKDLVRYYGEPIALAVADSPYTAARAALSIRAEYECFSPVLSVSQAAAGGSVLHENLADYTLSSIDVYPQGGTNICDRKQIRKGDIDKGFQQSSVTIEENFALPQSGHLPMETHAASAKVLHDVKSGGGSAYIKTSSQASFVVRKTLSGIFGLPESKITVKTPYVGGGFGGKTDVFLEILAYIGSLASGGREVCIINSREDDITAASCRMGLEAVIKLGADSTGKLKAAKLSFLLDTGAYAGAGPRIIKAIAADCTGPYNIENVWCDCLCVYTNNTPVTAFRGFGHMELTFCIERAMDALAKKLCIDPVRLREINAVKPGAWSPGAVRLDSAGAGDIKSCITRVKELIGWDGSGAKREGGIIKAKGIACFWKAPIPPQDAVSGAVVTFNYDGSVNLSCGCCEAGPASKTTAARILAAKLRMDMSRVSVNMDVDTSYAPEYWETAASLSTHMTGIAVTRAAHDAVKQIIRRASLKLGYPPERLEYCGDRVLLVDDSTVFILTRELVRDVIGRGVFSFDDLSLPDRYTGTGKTGPHRTVGAQAVELEFCEREYTYRLINTVSVIDAGEIIDPVTAASIIKGGVCMGLSIATRESFLRSGRGILQNTSFRTYKVMRFGQTPSYCAEFIKRPGITETPQNAYGLGEHGVIGIPAAFCAAISNASGLFLKTIPVTPEMIWRYNTNPQREGFDDTL